MSIPFESNLHHSPDHITVPALADRFPVLPSTPPLRYRFKAIRHVTENHHVHPRYDSALFCSQMISYAGVGSKTATLGRRETKASIALGPKYICRHGIHTPSIFTPSIFAYQPCCQIC